jgi:AraC family transcriptional regulator
MVNRQEENSLKELEALQKVFPIPPSATSYGMAWKGLQALRYRNSHVHLIRHTTGAQRLPVSADGVLSRGKLRTVVEYIMENLEGSPTLGQMAAVVNLSPYHFARQFKAATGLPPYQYVIARRIERAQHLLQRDGELGLAEVALRVGFSDQSKFSFHFKRMVGITPGQFRTCAR